MENPVLKTEKLTKIYGKSLRDRNTALDHVDLELEKGRIYALVGNNGSGKTTLMRLIAGLSTPTEGKLTLFGADTPEGLTEARKQLGVLIDSPVYYDYLTVMQNLRSQALLFPKETPIDLKELCSLTGITKDFASRRISKCSQGQKQRYGLAAALMGEPQFLLLDEPLNGLDPGGVIEIRELLLRLNREKGITMLISGHILSELHKTATDYIFFKRGHVLETLTAQELEERIAAEQLKDVEDYFIRLNRSAAV